MKTIMDFQRNLTEKNIIENLTNKEIYIYNIDSSRIRLDSTNFPTLFMPIVV